MISAEGKLGFRKLFANRTMLVVGILILLGISLIATRQAKAEGFGPPVEQWKPFEIELVSAVEYDNPYLDVNVSAAFEGPGGVEMTMPGYWEGGNRWKIRFAAPVPGDWKYKTVSTDPTNVGLHNKEGEFAVESYTGELEIYKRGFLKPSDNNRYLVYGDGTPFFWLGDTHWMGLSGREKLYESNDARFASQFKGMADTRKVQGYNVYAMTLFGGDWGDVSPAGTYNEGGPIWNETGYSTSHSSLASPSTGGYSFGSKKAVDGNEGTKWQAASASFPQWIEIDFGTGKSIENIDIEFGDADTWFYTIEGSADRIQYSTLIDRSAIGATGKAFADAVSAEVRYLRVTVTGTGSGNAPSIVELTPYDEHGKPLNNDGLFRRLNPDFWHNVDERMEYLSAKGFVSALGLDWGRNLEAANEDDYIRLARYVVARYGAYPVVWLGAGEYATGCSACWGNVSSYIYDIDPYERLNFLHNAVWNPDQFRDQDWYQMDYLQAGHGSQKPKTYWLDQYNESPTKVMIEGEANYENINGIPSKNTRESAWNALISGSAGFTYGAEGIWQSTGDDLDTWQVWNEAPTPWYTALGKAAGEQMKFLKDFFTAISWWTLSPDADAIEWNGAPPLTSASAPYQMSNADRSLVIAYLPSHSSTYAGTVKQLDTSYSYSAQWFNSRNGSYIDIANLIAPNSAGEWNVPPQPTAADDWALLIQQTSNRAAKPVTDKKGGIYSAPVSVTLATYSANATIYYTVDGTVPNQASGEIYFGPLLISEDTTLKAVAVEEGGEPSPVAVEYYRFSGNLVLDRVYSSSTNYDSAQTADKAFDGSVTTNWQANNNATAGQWIEVDFGRNTTFNKAALSEYGNRIQAYRIEYWDGTGWQTAYTGTAIGPDSGYVSQVVFPAVTGSKARLYVASAKSQPIIYEFELYDVPTGLTAAGGQGATALSWNPQSATDRYAVRRSSTPGGPYRTIATDLSMNAFTDTGLSNLTKYYYIVSSVSDSGMEKGSSGEAFATTRGPRTLTAGGDYRSSSDFNGSQTADKAFDGLTNTNWQAAVGSAAGQWLEVDFGEDVAFNKANLSEYGNRTTGYRLEYWNGSEWLIAYTGTSIGAHSGTPLTVSFPEVFGNKARIYFTSAISQPIIYEFQIFSSPSDIAAAGGKNRVDLAWKPIEDAAFYRIKRSMYAGGPFAIVASRIASTNFRDTGLLDGATYYYSVSAVTVEGEGDDSAIVAVTTEGSVNYAYGKAYSSSSEFAATQSAKQAFDGSARTNWQAASGRFANEWLEVNLGAMTTFDKVILSEFGNRTTGYRIEYWNGSSWQTAYAGTTIGPVSSNPLTVIFSPVTGSKARIYFTAGTPQPIIYEFGIYND